MDDLQSEHHAERSRILRENKRLTAVVSEIRRDHSMDLQAVKADADRVLASKDSEIRRLKSDLLSVQRQLDSQRKVWFQMPGLGADFLISQEIEQTAAELKEAEKRLDSQRSQYDRLTRGQKDTTSVSLDDHRRLVNQLRESLQACEEKASELAKNNKTLEASLKIAEERISRLQAERASTADELMAFERDLRNQQKESQRFGVELQKLKVDQQSKAARHALQLATSEREVRIAQQRIKIVERELLEAQKARASMESQQASWVVHLQWKAPVDSTAIPPVCWGIKGRNISSKQKILQFRSDTSKQNSLVNRRSETRCPFRSDICSFLLEG